MVLVLVLVIVNGFFGFEWQNDVVDFQVTGCGNGCVGQTQELMR